MKAPLLPLFSAVLIALPAGLSPAERLRFAPEEGSQALKRFETQLAIDVESFVVRTREGSMEIGIKINDVDPADYEATGRWEIVVRDTYTSLGAGRPRELQRRYDELAASYRSSFGDRVELDARDDLTGAEVRFRWDEDLELYRWEMVESSPTVVPDWWRGVLAEDMDLRPLLPPAALEPGERWQVRFDELGGVLFPGIHPRGLLAFEDTPFGLVPEALLDVFADGLEQELLDLVYKGTTAGVATIELAARVRRDLDGADLLEDERVRGLFLGATPTGLDLSLELDFSGELQWDRALGRFTAYELGAEGPLELAWTALWTQGGPAIEVLGEIEVSLVLLQRGSADQ